MLCELSHDAARSWWREDADARPFAGVAAEIGWMRPSHSPWRGGSVLPNDLQLEGF